jgi:hypothetical protein
MSRGEDDLPRCHFCSEHDEGQRYTFWGGSYLSTERKRAFLSSTTTVTTRYSNMKRVGIFACHRCANRLVLLSLLPILFGSGSSAVGCAVAGAILFSGSAAVGWFLLGLAGVSALVFLWSLAVALSPNLSSGMTDAVLCKRATPSLIRKGKGDSFFTEAQYEQFTLKAKDRPETAEEILEGAGITDENIRPSSRISSEDLSNLTRCPACAKFTLAKKTCRFCGTRLP